MTKRNQADRLLAHFTGPFLSGIASGDESVEESLAACHCPINNACRFPYRFRLGKLFDAVWLHASQEGIPLDDGLDWNKEFKAFCGRLMAGWPLNEFHAHGVTVRLAYKSNSHARTEYEISRI